MPNSVVGALRIDLAMNAGQFRRDAKQVEADLGNLGRAIGNISAKIDRASVFINTGIFAAQRFASVSQGILGVASSFEKGMSNVATLIDTNTENLGQMSDAVIEIGRRTPVALTDLTQGLFDMRSAGIGAEDAMRLLEGSARLGVAALGTTAETVTSSHRRSTLSAWKGLRPIRSSTCCSRRRTMARSPSRSSPGASVLSPAPWRKRASSLTNIWRRCPR